MNLLIDANLSPRLANWLRQRGHEALHLADVQSLRLADRDVWALAAQGGKIIVTKDADFYERSLILGRRRRWC